MALSENFSTSECYFESCINFLSDFEWLYNFSNTELLVKNVLEHFPIEWKMCFNNMTYDELCHMPAGEINETWPSSLKQFFKELNALKPKFSYTECISSNHKNLQDDLGRHATGMSKKKQHEVLNLVKQIEQYCDDVNVIVDVGSGLGYLSQFLHEKCGFHVLGIEADETNIRSAKARQMKWFPKSLDKVLYVHHRVTPKSCSAINEYLKNTGWDLTNGVCMVGLHTCGDLVASAIDIFNSSSFLKKLVVMPCCYHRMQFKNIDGAEIFQNFPSSKILKQKFESARCAKYFRRPFLRLACQQRPGVWESFDGFELEARSFRLLSRSILELYVKKENLLLVKNKRKATKKNGSKNCFQNFLTDVEIGYTIKHLFEFNGTSEYEFAKHSNEMTRLWQSRIDEPVDIKLLSGALLVLQACMQPVCENLLLLDKVERLNESNVVENAKFIKIANEAISARCFCLVASKKDL